MVTWPHDMVIFLLHRHHTLPHRHNTPLHRHHILLHRQHSLLHRHQSLLHRHDILLHRHDILLHRHDILLHRHHILLHRHHILLHRHDILLHRHDILLHRHQILLHRHCICYVSRLPCLWLYLLGVARLPDRAALVESKRLTGLCEGPVSGDERNMGRSCISQTGTAAETGRYKESRRRMHGRRTGWALRGRPG